MTDFEPKINVDLGDSIPFLWDKFSRILGKDPELLELQTWFYELQRIGWNDASSVQCIGMHTPLPLKDIYRPTRLLWQATYLSIISKSGERRDIQLAKEPVTPDTFLRTDTSAAIVAGPGWGKTTFLHYLFLHFIKSSST